ncbi:MAG TPA: DEAD/DEAH box helicase, partial [Polyangia bacterium]
IVGSVDEDFAIDSMAGDIFLLGNNSWKIRRIENGRVRVEDAAGQPPSIPFWFGESPGRSLELSAEVGTLREEIITRTGREDPPAVIAWLRATCRLDQAGAALVRDYVLAGHSVLGAVPTQTCVVAERFFDESGGMQLVVHAPFGARINRAWGMALRKRFCRSFDFELQAAATDDGVLLSLGAQHSFPLETIFDLLRADDVDEVLTQAILQAPMFETRWRWNATRSLALLRRRGGKKVPPNLQRMRAQDLITAVFPGQTACQDNHGGGAIEVPDHPLVSETVRDCLVEATDAAGLVKVLRALEAGEIRRIARDVVEPSLFSHEILNANPYAFLDDAPLEERRSRAVALRRGLPAELAEELGALDPDAVAAVIEEASPTVRSPDELHEVLLELGALPETEGEQRGWRSHFEQLLAARRATRLMARDAIFWVAAERKTLTSLAWPDALFLPDVTEPAARGPVCADHEAAVVELVRGRMTIVGPTTVAVLAQQLRLGIGDVEAALCQVEMAGAALRGRFLESSIPASESLLDPSTAHWCDRRLLARIHRRTLDRLRREIEPVSVSAFIRFLCDWQHIRPGAQLSGRDGLRMIIEQLQGFEAAAGAWEQEILPARLVDYEPAWLDELCLGGEVVWGRFECRPLGASPPSRAAPIGLGLRQNLSWLLGPRMLDEGDEEAPVGVSEPSAKVCDVLGYLERAGASFLDDIVLGARRLRAEVEEALWELVSAGRITADGFAALRSLLPTAGGNGGSQRKRWHSRWTRQRAGTGAGRWSLLRPSPLPARALDGAAEDTMAVTSDPADVEARNEALARQYIRRWGVVFRDLIRREPHAPPWRDLVRIYRRQELRGEVRGGRIVAGVGGEQFASPDALSALRASRKKPHSGEVIALSACDPLNLVGVITPGARIPATLANTVIYRDGIPVDDRGQQLPEAAASPGTEGNLADVPSRPPRTTPAPLQ